MDKIKIKRITLIRAEGPNHQCGKELTASGWDGANVLLRDMSNTAPKDGGDKVDFRIEFADGFVCPGTYSLKHWEKELPDMQARLRGIADFYAGKRRPADWSEEQYRKHMEVPYVRRLAEAYSELLHAYDI